MATPARSGPQTGVAGIPSLGRVHHLSLSVTDLEKSTAWYQETLGFEVWSEVVQPTFRRVRLRQPTGNLVVTLTCHQDKSGDRFDERRTGLDHVAFSAGSIADVHNLKAHFERLEVVHSEVRTGEGIAVVTLRDPDNIQVEVFGGDG